AAPVEPRRRHSRLDVVPAGEGYGSETDQRNPRPPRRQESQSLGRQQAERRLGSATRAEARVLGVTGAESPTAHLVAIAEHPPGTGMIRRWQSSQSTVCRAGRGLVPAGAFQAYTFLTCGTKSLR